MQHLSCQDWGPPFIPPINLVCGLPFLQAVETFWSSAAQILVSWNETEDLVFVLFALFTNMQGNSREGKWQEPWQIPRERESPYDPQGVCGLQITCRSLFAFRLFQPAYLSHAHTLG